MPSHLPSRTPRGLHAALSCALLALLLNACEDDLPSPSEPGTELPRDAGSAADAGLAADAGFDAASVRDAEPPPSTRDAGSGAPLDAGQPAPDAGGAGADGSAADASVTPADASADAAPPERSGDFAVGTRRLEIGNDAGRVVPVQLWYPALDVAAAEADAGHPIQEFEVPGARRQLLEKLIAEARKGCPNLTMHAALDATPYPRSAPFPLLVYSHHFNGSRFSMFSIAEQLARAGMVVAAPDHVGGTLFERQDALIDALNQFNEEFLQTRVGDLRRLLDVLLDPAAEAVPAGLRGRLDPARVGAIGHSLGSITVGLFSVNDKRVRASAYLAMNPSPSLPAFLFSLPSAEAFRTPALYLTASDDYSVATTGGMEELVANYEAQPLPAYWVAVRDTGHFSFADDLSLVPELDEGCGTGTRVADGASFMYLDQERAREIAARYSTAFFAAQLAGAPVAQLVEAQPADLVTVQQHGAKPASP